MVLIFTDSAFLTRRAGAYRIASSLRLHGVEVEVIDYLSLWNIDQLIEILKKIKIEWVGFSLSYLNYHKPNPNTITDLDTENETKLIEFLKLKNIPIAIGGANADTIKNFVNDFWIFIGYSDLSITKFHDHITKKSPLEWTIINKNKVIYSDEKYNNFLLNFKTTFIKSDFILNDEMIPIEISRGCIFKCKFCEFAYLGKVPGTYIRDKESIKQDIENSYYNFNTKSFLFVDDTFNDSIEKMEMIKEIRQESRIPFSFWSYGRLDLMSRFPKMIDLIPEIGWDAITFGIETMNKKSGSSVGKGADPEKLQNTLKNLKKRFKNVHVQCNLIIGLPHSTKKDIWETVNWFLENNAADYLRVVDLDIRDPSNLRHSSEFSKQPEKFGYQIISTDKLRYNWKNNNWTVESSKEFAKEVNEYIDKNKENSPYWKRYFLEHFSTVNNFLSKQEYIKQKINHFKMLTYIP